VIPQICSKAPAKKVLCLTFAPSFDFSFCFPIIELTQNQRAREEPPTNTPPPPYLAFGLPSDVVEGMDMTGTTLGHGQDSDRQDALQERNSPSLLGRSAVGAYQGTPEIPTK